MAKRSTISVAKILEAANIALACTEYNYGLETEAERQARRFGICSMLEHVLHQTDNYRGFNYLDAPFVKGTTDESRRHYY